MISSGLCSRSVAILKTQRGSKPGWEMDPPEQADKRRRGVAALWVIYFVIYLFAYLRIYLFTYLLITVGASPGWLSVCPAALSVSNFLTSPFCSRTIVFPAPKKLKKLEKLQEGGIIDYWLLLPSRKKKLSGRYSNLSPTIASPVHLPQSLSSSLPHTHPRFPPPPFDPPFHPPARPGLTACNGEPHLSRLLLAVGYRQRNRRRPLSRVPPLPSWPFTRRLDFAPQTRPVAGTRQWPAES